MARRKVTKKSNRADALALKLKNWWACRHTLHLLVTITGVLAASATLFITAHGFWVYVSEAPARAEQSQLMRLQTVNAAWDTVRTTKGFRSERGQSFALQVLVASGVDLTGLDLTNTSVAAVSLRRARFPEANLNGTVLTRVALDGGAMSGASMRGAILEHVAMDRMEGLPATIENAFVIETVMSSKLESGLVASAPMDLRSSLVVHSTLDLPMNRMDFRNACLFGVSFHLARPTDDPDLGWGAVLRQANFSSAIIGGGNFRRADLDGADFRNARFVRSSALSRKITEIREATQYRWDDSTAGRLAELANQSHLPSCLVRQSDLMVVLNTIERLSGDAVTPPDSCCASSNDIDNWLGGGRSVTDFTGASLKGTRFESADLRATIGISQVELDQACVDEGTQLPRGLRRPIRRCMQVDAPSPFA